MIKIIFGILLISLSLIFSQELSINGIVINKENGEAIPYVSIRIGGTTQGTSSNLEGKFTINLSEKNDRLIFTAVGFKKKEVSISARQNNQLKIEMQPEPIRMMEIVVGAAEDPAYRIIREAIKRKKENYAGLVSLEYDFFTKNIMLSAGNVASVAEKFSTGYFQINKKEKVVIHSIHATENEKKNLAKFDQNIIEKSYVNFSADSIEIVGSKVFLPLADNAFDWYDYKLIKVNQTENVHDCYIEVIPKSDIQPLLQGQIVIEDSTYSLKSIELRNNDGLRFPFVTNLKIAFTQTLDRFEKYWLPTYFKVESSLKVNFSGIIGLDEIAMNDVYLFNKYKINPTIPDSIYNIRTALKSDTTKFKNRLEVAELNREAMESIRPIPLTKDEVNAYKELDSTKTLPTQLKFSGVLAGVAENAVKQDQQKKSGTGFFNYVGKVFSILNFSDNRVNGILLGAKYNSTFFSNAFKFHTSFSYAFSRKEFEGDISFALRIKNFFIQDFGIEIYNNVSQWQLLNPYPELLNSASVALGFEDQFNYLLAKGFQISARSQIIPDVSLTTKFTYEDQSSVNAVKYQSIFSRNRFVRVNPEIEEGMDNRFSFNLLINKSPQDFQPITESGALIEFDLSNPLIGSHFNYKRLRFVSQLSTKTFYGELFSSPYLVFGLEGGIVLGEYGIQHTLTPNSALAFYSPLHSFKGLTPYEVVGDKMIGAHFEHNWKTVPFQALGLNFLADLFIDFTFGGSVLQMWNDSKYFSGSSENKFYYEGYISFGKILGIGRVDFCYTSQKDFVVRAGLATFF